MKTKTHFLLMEGLGRHFLGNKSIFDGSQSKFKHLCIGEGYNVQSRKGVSGKAEGM